MEKYFKQKYKNAEIISKIIEDLYRPEKNILFIRTPTTGDWFDRLFKNKSNVTRILYKTDITDKFFYHKSTHIITHDELFDKIKSFNQKFDLIGIDPYHEFEFSKKDFETISLFLSDTGMIISHDCLPKTKLIAEPKFIKGEWSGMTYLAFINFAYNNPNLYYALLNIDTGIGIISKKQFEGVKNNLYQNKQLELLELFVQDPNNVYDFFYSNRKELINLIE